MRARNIKPGFFTCPELVSLAPVARLLFAGLWCAADREGRLEDRPAKIKLQVLPGDDVDVDALLGELAQAGFIIRYAVTDGQYIHIVNFQKHQRPHKNEQASVIPPSPNEESTTKVVLEHDQGDTKDALIPSSLIPDTGFSDSPTPDSLEDGWNDPEVEKAIQTGGKRNAYRKR